MRRLILLRHAKAVRPDFGLDDFDRGLEPRGRHEAERLSFLLADLFGGCDVALVSSAQRTQETWSVVAPAFPAVDAIADDRLYLASSESLRAAAAKVQDRDTVLMVGHNPGLKDLADDLMGEGPHDVRACTSLARGLPTSCAIVLGVNGAPEYGAARLAAFVAPPRESD